MISIILCFTGCSKSEIEEKSFDFSLLFNSRSESPYSEQWPIWDEYEKRRGVLFDVTIGDDSDYRWYVVKALESDSPPDIILKVFPEEIAEYANKGLVLPISDYVEDMPFFQSYIAEHSLEEEIESLKQEDGKYYVLPGYQRAIQVQQWIYREDLFTAAGLGIPQTYEELFSDLVILYEQYPDSTPLSACWGGAHLYSMMGAGYGITSGWSGNRSFNEQTKRWEYAPATEAYREMYRFLHRCYEADLFALDEINQTVESFIEKLTDNSIFFTPTWISSGFDSWNTKLVENGYQGAQWSVLPVLESTVGLKTLPPVNRFRKGLVISSKVLEKPYLDELISFIDWAVYSEEGQTLTTWGIEGETFEFTEDGPRYLPEMQSFMNPEGERSIYIEYGLDQIFNLCENEELEDLKKPADIVSFLERSEMNEETLPIDPILELSPLELDTISKIDESIDAYANNASIRFITGELDIEGDWEEYLAELGMLGYQSLETIWNTAHQGGLD